MTATPLRSLDPGEVSFARVRTLRTGGRRSIFEPIACEWRAALILRNEPLPFERPTR